jgi:hypothetical protein
VIADVSRLSDGSARVNWEWWCPGLARPQKDGGDCARRLHGRTRLGRPGPASTRQPPSRVARAHIIDGQTSKGPTSYAGFSAVANPLSAKQQRPCVQVHGEDVVPLDQQYIVRFQHRLIDLCQRRVKHQVQHSSSQLQLFATPLRL